MKRLFLRLACIAFVAAMALRCDTRSPVDPDSSGSPPTEAPPIQTQMASIRGTVMAGVSPLRTAVSITGPGITRTAWSSSVDGAFIFVNLRAGVYTMTTAPPGFTCESATVDVLAGQIGTASIACAQQAPGTISGTVTAGGSGLSGVMVRVTRAFRPVESAFTDGDGVFTLTVPSGGPYAVTAAPGATTCQSATSIMVEEDRTVSVDIVCSAAGGIEGVVGWTNGSRIRGVQVTLNGPVSRSLHSSEGGFWFGDLPPGDYTVTAFRGCQPVTATVQVAHLTSVEILCDLPDFREIAGDFFFYLPRENEDRGYVTYSQVGDCPPPLPEERTRRSITFDPASSRISIVGLDPDLTIVGDLQESDRETQRAFSGTGSAARADGSSIRSELTGAFGFSTFDRGYYYFGGTMARVHRGPGGELVCTETYEVGGSKPL